MSKPLKCTLHYVPNWPGWNFRSFVWVCEHCLQIRGMLRDLCLEYECEGNQYPTEAQVKLLSQCTMHDHSYDRDGFFNPRKYGYR